MAQDLSHHHRPVGELFPQAVTQAQWDEHRLSEDQLAFYHEHGYLPGVQLLQPAQIDALRAELAELVEPDHDGRELWYEYHTNEADDPNAVLFHSLGAWRLRPAMHDILWNPAFLVPASQLLGGSVRFWHDQLFCKPARDGGVVAWHQDYSYWTRTKPMAHLSCWIGLDDATTDNGCIQYVPGSHRWDLLPMTNLANDMEAIREVLSDEQRKAFKPVPAELRAGQCAFHHPLTVHGSYENRSDRPRRAIVLNVIKDGTVADDDKPLLQGTEAFAVGDPVAGRFFPLLYEPKKS